MSQRRVGARAGQFRRARVEYARSLLPGRRVGGCGRGGRLQLGGDTQSPAKHGWQSSWRAFDDVLGPAVASLRAFAPRKPLYVSETASAPSGGDKAAWVRAAASLARGWDVEALCWFEANKEIDWRFGAAVAPEVAREFARALSDDSSPPAATGAGAGQARSAAE